MTLSEYDIMENSIKRNILLSVKPQYANCLVDGIKTIELRKVFPTNLAIRTKLYIYSSAPEQKVIGEVVIDKVLQLPLKELWKVACYKSLIPWEGFCKYYEGKEMGVAIFVKIQKRYDVPILLSDFYPFLKRPPQSYCYLPERSVYNEIIRCSKSFN